MVLTSWSSQVVKWHKSLQDLTALCEPVVRKNKPKIGTTLKPYLKTDVPRLVEHFEPDVIYTDEHSTTLFAYFNTLVANKAATVTPLTTDDTPIVLDSGCSVAISNDKFDFPNGFTLAPPDAGIRGIGSKLPVLGHGMIRWKLTDVHGACVNIEVNGLYVPQCPVNLLPPQQLIRANGMHKTNCTIIGTDHCRVFYQGHIIDFPYDERSNLPIRKQQCGSSKYVAALLALPKPIAPAKGAAALLKTSPDLRLNTNLTGARKSLLDIHRQCGHVDMQLLQTWARHGQYDLPKAIGHCAIPICPDCQFGGARRKSHNTKQNGRYLCSIPSW